MTAKEEELNKQLQQIEKLTPEQILGGIRVWLGDNKEDPKYTLDKKTNTSPTAKE